MTPSTLDEIEAKAKAATLGPWRACGDERGGCLCHMIWSKDADVVIAVSLSSKDEAFTGGSGVQDEAMVRANALHMAMMDPPTTLALVARVRELEEAMTEYASMTSGECWSDAGRLARRVMGYEAALAVSGGGGEGKEQP